MKNQFLRTRSLLFLSLLISVSIALAQKKPAYPEDALLQSDYSAHLRFLASDELMGRMTGSPWIDVAARYVAEQFRACGLATFPGIEGYYQPVPLQRRIPPAMARIVILGDTLVQGQNMMMKNRGVSVGKVNLSMWATELLIPPRVSTTTWAST